MTSIMLMLKAMVDQKSSDLHLRAGTPPVFRINGTLYRARSEPLRDDEIDGFVRELVTPQQYEAFLRDAELDAAAGIPEIGRFRINVFRQRGSVSMAIRSIRTIIPNFEELKLPTVILDLAMKKRGLILVTGTTGSGKSTLLASMIDHINKNTAVNVVTAEDPIEFWYSDNRSIIAQREIGPDTHSFANALRASFRQDPDVILIGEIRDKETMETALSASDTGHMVMSTLHTMNAVETISRIITFFPPHQHEQVRLVLSNVLVAVISLRLLPRKDGAGRVPAAEIMVNNATIAEYVRDPEKTGMILSAVAEGNTQYGSQTFDQSLFQLYKDDLITYQIAKQYASNPDDFELRVGGIGGTSDRRWEPTASIQGIGQ
jgi:twitching motility protein PilT